MLFFVDQLLPISNTVDTFEESLNTDCFMLVEINPKLPMRNKAVTQDYYVNQLGFELLGDNTYDGYLMVCKDNIQLHFFEFKALDPRENYGQVYIRTTGIDQWYEWLVKKKVAIHPNGHLANKPWGQREFSLLDPDNNLLTFGEPVAVVH